MSSNHDAQPSPDQHHDDAADAHDQEEHHGPPPPPEPTTPMWLPAVGAVLFLTVGLFWALSTPPKDPTETIATADAKTAATTNPVVPAQTVPPANLPPPHTGNVPLNQAPSSIVDRARAIGGAFKANGGAPGGAPPAGGAPGRRPPGHP